MTRTVNCAAYSGLALVMGVLTIQACSGNECSRGEQRCRDSFSPQWCAQSVSDPDALAPGIYAPGDYHWADGSSCDHGTSCVQLDAQTAICAYSNEPVDSCKSGGDICWQGSVASCNRGYAMFTEACNLTSCRQGVTNGASCAYCDNGSALADACVIDTP